MQTLVSVTGVNLMGHNGSLSQRAILKVKDVAIRIQGATKIRSLFGKQVMSDHL